METVALECLQHRDAVAARSGVPVGREWKDQVRRLPWGPDHRQGRFVRVVVTRREKI